MRYGPAIKTNGTAFAKLGDVFEAVMGTNRETILSDEQFPMLEEVEIFTIKDKEEEN